MKSPPKWLRVLAILFASVVTMATTVVSPDRIWSRPQAESLLFETNGLIVYTKKVGPFAEKWGGKILEYADHVDGTFVIKNTRADTVHLSTRESRLILGDLHIPNILPVELTLEPGESRELQLRFTLKSWQVRRMRRVSPSIYLGLATLSNGTPIEIVADLQSDLLPEGPETRR